MGIVLRRCYRFIPAVVCMALIFWFSSMPANEVLRAANPLFKHAPSIQIVKPILIPWLKVGHFIGYSLLGAALLFGFGESSGGAVFRGFSLRHMFYAIAVTVLYAVSDEIHQTFVPGRHAWLSDVAIDTGAACFSILLIQTTLWMKQTPLFKLQT